MAPDQRRRLWDVHSGAYSCEWLENRGCSCCFCVVMQLRCRLKFSWSQENPRVCTAHHYLWMFYSGNRETRDEGRSSPTWVQLSSIRSSGGIPGEGMNRSWFTESRNNFSPLCTQTDTLIKKRAATLASDCACGAGWILMISSHTSCWCETVWNGSAVWVLVEMPGQLSLYLSLCLWVFSHLLCPLSFADFYTCNVSWTFLKLALIFGPAVAACPVQFHPN